MASSENFYGGSNYKSFSEDYGNKLKEYNYHISASQIGIATDARTANQIKATTEKINTGGRVVEVQMVTPDVAESIPNQHLDELRRLKKITGVDLTLHGPLVEPTGVSRQGWDETNRMQAENQIWSSLERGHKLSPDGNLVVTFHSSNGLPEPETKYFDKKKGEEVKTVWVVDERSGQFSELPHLKYSYFKDKKEKPKDAIEKQNEEVWYRNLQHVNHSAGLGMNDINRALIGIEPGQEGGKMPNKETQEKMMKIYAEYLQGKEGPETKKITEDYKPLIKDKMEDIVRGDIYLREAYTNLQDLYNQAYYAAEKDKQSNKEEVRKKAIEDLKKLNKYREEEIRPLLKDIEKPENVVKLGEEISKGVQVLRSVRTPQTLRPLRDFAIDKASTTFANVAVKSYDKFGDTSPIISIENPPSGMGLSRAKEIKELIEKAQDKFVEKATKSEEDGGFGLSKDEARKKAEKLIGATWDVGHINMIRKHGYGTEELKKETETIAKHIKHVHLSDNFGLEHTELPMGMGNVPMKEHEAALRKQFGDKLKNIKRIIETGNWYQHFQTTPLLETFEALGSPVYGMKMAPYWNQASGITSGYFAGYGMNPEIHHSIYGAGFGSLPTELGGQMAGKSRLSGTPTE